MNLFLKNFFLLYFTKTWWASFVDLFFFYTVFFSKMFGMWFVYVWIQKRSHTGSQPKMTTKLKCFLKTFFKRRVYDILEIEMVVYKTCYSSKRWRTMTEPWGVILVGRRPPTIRLCYFLFLCVPSFLIDKCMRFNWTFFYLCLMNHTFL